MTEKAAHLMEARKQKEKRDQGSKIPFKGMFPMT
jgi:hypothetical protein